MRTIIKKWKKSCWAFAVLSGLLLIGVGMPVNAAELEDCENVSEEVVYIGEYTSLTRNAIIKTCSASLAVSGGTAICNGTGSVYTSMASSVKITMYLQRNSNSTWSNVTTWSTSASSIAVLSKTATVSTGTYRVKVVCTAGNETVTVYSTTKTY